MLLPLRYLLWILTRLFVSLRYRVRVHGLEQVRNLKGPVLVLPNHPGLVDPLLVLAAVWPSLKPRPMVFEGHFNNPFLSLLVKLLNAVRVPDLDQASAKARSRAQKAVEVVIAGLRNGENYILWPSGHTQRDGVERLGGAAPWPTFCRRCPRRRSCGCARAASGAACSATPRPASTPISSVVTPPASAGC